MLKGFRRRPSHGNLAALVEGKRDRLANELRIHLNRAFSAAYQRGGVRGYVVVQASHESGQAKVRDFADQVGVDQHVSSRQIPVDEVSLGEVAHPCPDAPEHPDQLQNAELTLVLLEEDNQIM